MEARRRRDADKHRAGKLDRRIAFPEREVGEAIHLLSLSLQVYAGNPIMPFGKSPMPLSGTLRRQKTETVEAELLPLFKGWGGTA